jgi:demethoxyubiquinone hydroxylase (CLK1/Coq7/Cat5 family)
MTEAEKRLKEEAERAKNKLLQEIKQFKVDENEEEQTAEPEDPRV